MQESTSPISNAADESSSETNFVLDFLYYDTRRIASYLSQFDPDGHLLSVTKGKSGTRGKKDSSSKLARGGVLGFAEGTYTAGTEYGVDMTHGYERVFDPHWSNARLFLDHLSESNLIEGDIGEAEIGQFVLTKGFLNVLDLTMMKSAWQMNAVNRAMKQGIMGVGHGSQNKNLTAAQKSEEKAKRENAELILELMQIMPHAVNATLITKEGPAYLVWCALHDEFLSIPASEIVMTHGGSLQGDWSVLGVLSALPDLAGVNGLLNPVQPTAEVGIMDSIVGRASALLAPMVRVGLGRPANAHAVTPLLIFREIAQRH